MKIVSWKWLFIIWACCVLSPTWASNSTVWKTLAPGLEYTRLGGFTNFPQGYVHAFRINLKQYYLKVAPLPTNGQSTAGFYRLMTDEDAVIATNGGFFTPELKPLGLRIAKNEPSNPFRPVNWWGVLFIQDRKASLVRQEDYKPSENIEFAIEAGPPLIVDGEVVAKPTAKIDARTAIGVTSNGEIILLATENTLLSVADLAELMQRPQTLGGLNCIQAINLDGGSSTQMYTHLPNFSLAISSTAHVADAVLIVPSKSWSK